MRIHSSSKYITLIFTTFLLNSCETPKFKTYKSQWSELKNSKEIDCVNIPLLKNELDISNFFIEESSGDSVSAFVSSRSRKAQNIFYHHSYAQLSDVKNRTKNDPLDIPLKSQFIPTYFTPTKLGFPFLAFEFNKGPRYEILSTEANQPSLTWGEVFNKDELFSDSNAIFVDPERILVFARVDSRLLNSTDEESDIDEKTSSWKLSLIRKGAENKNIAQFQSVSMRFAGKSDDNREYFFIWDQGSQSKSRFQISKFDIKDLSVVTKPLEVKKSASIEYWDAWNVGKQEGRFVLLEGDTIGGKSIIRSGVITWIGDNPVLRWLGSRSIDSYNVGQLYLLKSDKKADGDQPLLAFQEWLDEESTIRILKLPDSNPQSIGVFGVEERGQNLKQIIARTENELWAVIRKAKAGSLTGQYKICRIHID